jgi:hypothetical protein
VTEERFDSPPDAIDMRAAERAIRRAGMVALVAFGLASGLAVLLLPMAVTLPTALPERIAFALQASFFVLLWVVAGFLLVSTTRRVSPEDIGGAAAGPPSPRLRIYVAFLQNTLEQAVIASGAYLAYATLVEGPWLAPIVAAVALFWLGRLLFLRGYHRGVRGRALGMTLTGVPTILLCLAVVVLWLLRLF